MYPAALAGLTLHELEEILSPLPRFRAKQIFKWIISGAGSFDQMTDLPSSLRDDLGSRFRIYSGSIAASHEGVDTGKIVINLKDGAKIESVLLSDGKKRFTACLSTQVGCPAGCVFCKTGSMGFIRNLDACEIFEQFLFLRAKAAVIAGDTQNKDEHPIDNIVIMGMGEPLLNLAELRKAAALFNDPNGMNFSRRRITVSTCGICSGLFDIAKNGPLLRLAVSLTTADEELRQKLMPITRANPLKEVKEALVLFQKNGGGRVTLEIPLLGGINTREKDASSTAEFARGIDCVVNIIPWNPVTGLAFEGKPLLEPAKKEVADFTGKLESYGLKVTTRFRKGRSVMGACGQLGA